MSAEPEGVAQKRRFRLLDGAHRLTAARRLVKEYRDFGDAVSLQAAKRLSVLPVLVFRPCSEEEMALHASIVNFQNTQYVATTFLDRYTLIRRMYDIWTKKTKGRGKGNKKPKTSDFIKYATGQCADQGVLVKDVFGCNQKQLHVEVGLATSFHQETMTRMVELFEQDVSTILPTVS